VLVQLLHYFTQEKLVLLKKNVEKYQYRSTCAILTVPWVVCY